jgi:trans-aconitate methyltransferase
MSDRTSHWQTVYSTKAENEVSWFQADPAASLRMIADAKAAADSSIIDIGGGASRLVDALLTRGFHALTVLDISAAALETTRKRLGAAGENVKWIAADVTQWRPARTYGLWHDRAAFHFLTEASDRAAYVDRLHTAVSPRGQVIIATFAPDGPEKCSGLPVQRYDADRLAQTLGPTFALVDHLTETHRTPWNTTQSFQFSRFRRI